MKRVIAILIATIILGLCIMSVAQGAKIIANGATDQSISVVIYDADGEPNTTPATIADLDIYIYRDGESATNVGYAPSTKVDLVALASIATAHTDNRAIHLGNGLYRVDIPDANLSDGVGVMLTFMIVDAAGSNRTTYYEVQLNPPTDVNTVLGEAPGDYDAVIDEIQDNNALIKLIQTTADTIDTATGTTIPGTITAMQTNVDGIDANTATILSNTAAILTDTSAYDTDAEHAAAIWNALKASYAVENSFGELLNDNLDAVLSVSFLYTYSEISNHDANIVADIAAIDTSATTAAAVWADANGVRVYTDANTAAAATLTASVVYLRDTTIAAATDAKTFTLTAGSANNDAYLYHTITLIDASDPNNPEERVIIQYTGATKEVVVDRNFSFTPAAGDTARIPEGAYAWTRRFWK